MSTNISMWMVFLVHYIQEVALRITGDILKDSVTMQANLNFKNWSTLRKCINSLEHNRFNYKINKASKINRIHKVMKPEKVWNSQIVSQIWCSILIVKHHLISHGYSHKTNWLQWSIHRNPKNKDYLAIAQWLTQIQTLNSYISSTLSILKVL